VNDQQRLAAFFLKGHVVTAPETADGMGEPFGQLDEFLVTSSRPGGWP